MTHRSEAIKLYDSMLDSKYQGALHFELEFVSHTSCEIGSSTMTPEFRIGSKGLWRIEVFWNGFDVDTEGFVCLRLHLLSQPILRIACKVYMKNQISNKYEYEATTEYTKSSTEFSVWEVRKWMSRTQLTPNTGLCIKETIIIGAQIEYLGASGVSEAFPASTTPSIQNDFLKLFHIRREKGDITLVGTNQIKVAAHSLILCARSTTFAKLFASTSFRMGSSLLGWHHVNVDLSGGLLWEFVRFIYSDDIPFKNKSYVDVIELMKAAHHYHVQGLVYRCEAALGFMITDETVNKLLAVSKLTGSHILYNNCIEFMSLKLTAVPPQETKKIMSPVAPPKKKMSDKSPNMESDTEEERKSPFISLECNQIVHPRASVTLGEPDQENFVPVSSRNIAVAPLNNDHNIMASKPLSRNNSKKEDGYKLQEQDIKDDPRKRSSFKNFFKSY